MAQHWIYHSGQKPIDLFAVFLGDIRLYDLSREELSTLLVKHDVPINGGDGKDSMIETFARWRDKENKKAEEAAAQKLKQDAADNEVLGGLVRAVENIENSEAATKLAQLLRGKANGA